jgi:hypothetical protein
MFLPSKLLLLVFFIYCDGQFISEENRSSPRKPLMSPLGDVNLQAIHVAVIATQLMTDMPPL